MSLSEEQEILLSQLVDGELPADEANRVLAGVFDELAHVLGSSEAASKLNAMLQLRQSLDAWRRQAPTKPIVLPPAADALPCPAKRPARPKVNDEPATETTDLAPSALTLALSGHRPEVGREKGHVYRSLSLASAALLGGVLVAGGFFLGGQGRNVQSAVPIARQPAAIVTPEQRQEIAKAFNLHESVAGPLSWYAADDSTIQVAPAAEGETLRQPIAVILRLTRELSGSHDEMSVPKTYVIICRNSDAMIELPQSTVAKTVRLRLLPTTSNGVVSLQYAIAADGADRSPAEASLAGRRQVGLGQTSLGQLTMNDCLVNVDASAWVLENHAL